jgi:hypothetical protein
VFLARSQPGAEAAGYSRSSLRDACRSRAPGLQQRVAKSRRDDVLVAQHEVLGQRMHWRLSPVGTGRHVSLRVVPAGLGGMGGLGPGTDVPGYELPSLRDYHIRITNFGLRITDYDAHTTHPFGFAQGRLFANTERNAGHPGVRRQRCELGNREFVESVLPARRTHARRYWPGWGARPRP